MGGAWILTRLTVFEMKYSASFLCQYEESYNLFAEQSQQLISPEDYSTSYSPTYEITDYTFFSEDIQGDTADREIPLSWRQSYSSPVLREEIDNIPSHRSWFSKRGSGT
jgi:hypothetical protein